MTKRVTAAAAALLQATDDVPVVDLMVEASLIKASRSPPPTRANGVHTTRTGSQPLPRESPPRELVRGADDANRGRRGDTDGGGDANDADRDVDRDADRDDKAVPPAAAPQPAPPQADVDDESVEPEDEWSTIDRKGRARRPPHHQRQPSQHIDNDESEDDNAVVESRNEPIKVERAPPTTASATTTTATTTTTTTTTAAPTATAAAPKTILTKAKHAVAVVAEQSATTKPAPTTSNAEPSTPDTSNNAKRERAPHVTPAQSPAVAAVVAAPAAVPAATPPAADDRRRRPAATTAAAVASAAASPAAPRTPTAVVAAADANERRRKTPQPNSVAGPADYTSLAHVVTSPEELAAQRLVLHRLVDSAIASFMRTDFSTHVRSQTMPRELQQEAWMLLTHRITKMAMKLPGEEPTAPAWRRERGGEE